MICSILGDFYRNEYCGRMIVNDGEQQDGDSLEMVNPRSMKIPLTTPTAKSRAPEEQSKQGNVKLILCNGHLLPSV